MRVSPDAGTLAGIDDGRTMAASAKLTARAGAESMLAPEWVTP